MIRVTIELVPYGEESERRVLDVVEIWNDGTGSVARGNYGYRDSFGEEGRVEDFERGRGARALAAEVLADE